MNMRGTAFVLSLVMLCAVHAATGSPSGEEIEIEFGQVVRGETPGACYKIALDTPDRYMVEMLSVPEEMLTSIKVSGDSGNDFVAEAEAAFPGECVLLPLIIYDPGIYYVEIGELEGEKCGRYLFKVDQLRLRPEDFD